MNFSPAITSTAASALLMPLLCSLRLPSSDPIKPPTATATAHTGRASGRYRILAKLPASPAMELTRMKAAEVPDVGRLPAQPVNSSKGLRKIPPPVPVNPESRPIAPPQARWQGRDVDAFVGDLVRSPHSGAKQSVGGVKQDKSYGGSVEVAREGDGAAKERQWVEPRTCSGEECRGRGVQMSHALQFRLQLCCELGTLLEPLTWFWSPSLSFPLLARDLAAAVYGACDVCATGLLRVQAV
jgi:hypothetical protein